MGDRFTDFGARAVALSADGTHLPYTANQRLYLRPLDQLDPTPIRGTEVDLAPGGASRNLFFSPDGRWIGFWQDGQLKKVSITGGAPLPLCPSSKVGALLGTDVYHLPLTGERRPQPLLAEPSDELNAEVSPNGQWLAYKSNESGRLEILVARLGRHLSPATS